MRLFPRFTHPGAFAIALLVALVPAARATVIVVTTTNDETIDDGECSLREAVIASNTNAAFDGCPAGQPGATAVDEIDLATAVYTFSLGGPDENLAATGDLDIYDAVRIVGHGKDETVIDADHLDRIFDVLSDGASINGILQLEHLTVRNGDLRLDSSEFGVLGIDGGGAIRNGFIPEPTLTLAPAAGGEPRHGLEAQVAPASSLPFICGPLIGSEPCTVVIDSRVLDSTADLGGGILNLAFLILGDESIVVSAASRTPPPSGPSSLSSLTPPLSSSGGGGGIGGALVQGNQAELGGGIFNTGLAFVVHSSIDANDASSGGGIYNTSLEAFFAGIRLKGPAPGRVAVAQASSRLATARQRLHESVLQAWSRTIAPEIFVTGNLVVVESTVSRNHAIELTPLLTVPLTKTAALSIGGEGGGIWNQEGASLLNATVSGNTADLVGGGVFDLNPGFVQAILSTIVDNTAVSGDSGGGIFLRTEESGGEISLLDSIVANNLDEDCANDLSGTEGFTSVGGNIDSDDTCNLNEASDKPATDPVLGPLQDNGGPTETHLPLAGSPAIDMAIDASSPAPLRKQGAAASVDCGIPEDQRLFPRPVDGDGDGTAICDIGAVEVQVPLVVPALDPRGLALLVLILALGGLLVLRRSGG